jgi:hypothetical protein
MHRQPPLSSRQIPEIQPLRRRDFIMERTRSLLRGQGLLFAALLGLSAIRLLTLPQTPWELDEILFIEAIRDFDPGAGRPHPPGYPLLVGFGKAFSWVFGSPFSGLLALSFLSGAVGFVAFAAFAANLARRCDLSEASARGAGVAAALLYWGSPGLLVHGGLALSDAPALASLALALWAGERGLASPIRRVWPIATGVFAAAAIGFRPQLAVPVLPLLLVTAALARGRKGLLVGGASFAAICLAWFVPLVAQYDQPRTFFDQQARQANYVAANDAAAARARVDTETLFERFYVNAWGRRRYALPIFALALLGVALLIRHRVTAAWPLVAMATIHAVFCWRAMDPADGPRYGLPVGLLVALLAGLALAVIVRSSSWLAPAAAALYVVVWLTYVGPFLWARSHQSSPPFEAAASLRGRLQRGAIVLVEPRLAPHGREFLPRANRRSTDGGFDRFTDRPDTSLWVLADGPSGWPGGETFAWPDTHAFQELTRNFYRVVSVSPIPPTRRYEAISGVHAFEPSLGGARWRWLDRAATIRLWRGDSDTVRLGLALGPESPPNQTRIFVAGKPVGLISLVTGGATALDLALPTEATVELQLVSDTAFRSPEGRSLAVQLTSLELRHAAQATPPKGER